MANVTSIETPVNSDSPVAPEIGLDPAAELPRAKSWLVVALSDTAMRLPTFWSVVGRFPLYLINLALVVFTASRGSDYVSAGLLLGGYSLGAAVFAPLVGRCADRYGQTPVLLMTGIVYPLALIGFVVLVSGPLAAQLACVVVAGATTPPISGSIRSLWSANKGREHVGLSLETMLGNVFLLGGPLLLSVMLFCASAGVALVIGALLTGAGAIGFAATRASRTHPAAPSVRDVLGALRSADLIHVLLVVGFSGLNTGIYYVALPAFAAGHGASGDVGFFFGAAGVGGILSGLWYGRRKLRWPTELCFALGVLIMTTACALPAIAWDNWSMSVALLLIGAAEAPVTVLMYGLIHRTAPANHVTEAFTWAITVSIACAALGAQLGGVLISTQGTRTACAVAFAAMVFATAIAFVARRRFTAAARLSSPG